MSGITEDLVKACRAGFEGARGNKGLQNAMMRRGVMDLALDAAGLASTDEAFAFSDELDQTWSVCDQKSSGRCWIFSALTVLRVNAMDRALGVKDFEFSQVFVFFWFKFERAGYFLDEIIRTAARPDGDRLVDCLLASPAADGGQFDFFKQLVAKYGLVPKAVMPETFASEHTAQGFNPHLMSLLRSGACAIRRAWRAADGKSDAEKRDAMDAIKRNTLAKVWTLLCMHLGTPPERFSYRWTSTPQDDSSSDKTADKGADKSADKSKKSRKSKKVVREVVDITPVEFVKFCGLLDTPETDFTQFVSVVHDPRATSPAMRCYTVEALNVVAGAPVVRYLNLPSIERLKELAAACIKDGYPVWFGCDSGKFKNNARGLFDTACYDFKAVYGFDHCGMTKAERMIYADSGMSHAMVFTGVNIVDGKTQSWKVENSWGASSGNKGIYLITDDWFNEFVFEAAIPAKYLTEEERAAYAAEPIVLPAWDPMGILAHPN